MATRKNQFDNPEEDKKNKRANQFDVYDEQVAKIVAERSKNVPEIPVVGDTAKKAQFTFQQPTFDEWAKPGEALTAPQILETPGKEVTGAAKLFKPFAQAGRVGFNVVSEAVTGFVNKLDKVFSVVPKKEATTSEKAAAGAEVVSAGLGVIWSPFSAMFSAAEEIPLIKYPAKGLNWTVQKIGEGVGWGFGEYVQTLGDMGLISEKDKDLWKPVMTDIGATVAQLATFKAGHQILFGKGGLSKSESDLMEKATNKPESLTSNEITEFGRITLKLKDPGVMDKGLVGTLSKTIKTEIAKRKKSGTAIDSNEAQIIVSDAIKKVPVEGDLGELKIPATKTAEEIKIDTKQRLVLSNLIRDREDLNYEKVKTLGKDVDGNPIASQFKWDYKKQEGTILYTKNTTAENIAQELGHYFDKNLSSRVQKTLSDSVPEFLVQGKPLRVVSSYLTGRNEGKLSGKELQKQTKALVDNWESDISKLAKGESRKTRPEQFASAVREVLLRPSEAEKVAPNFTYFIEWNLNKDNAISRRLQQLKKASEPVKTAQKPSEAPKKPEDATKARKEAVAEAIPDLSKPIDPKKFEEDVVKLFIDKGVSPTEAKLRAEELYQKAKKILEGKESIEEKTIKIADMLEYELLTARPSTEAKPELTEEEEAQEYLRKKGVTKFRKAEEPLAQTVKSLKKAFRDPEEEGLYHGTTLEDWNEMKSGGFKDVNIADGIGRAVAYANARRSIQTKKSNRVIVKFKPEMEEWLKAKPRGRISQYDDYIDVLILRKPKLSSVESVYDLDTKQMVYGAEGGGEKYRVAYPELTTKVLEKLKGRETVSRQFISDLTNQPELKQVEREIVRDVLAAQKGETISVKEFSDKVKAELLPLKIEKGIGKGLGPKYESISLPDEFRGNVANYSEHIYTSPIKTSAGETHWRGQTKNYFGHARIEDMAPDKFPYANTRILANPPRDGTTRRVIEVQSDLYQKGGLENEMAISAESPVVLKYKGKDVQFVLGKDGKFEGRTLGLVARKVVATRAELAKENPTFFKKELPENEKKMTKLQQYNDPTAHFRMAREEVKQAAMDGKTKLQFPTGETAMKIEGLGDTTQWSFRDERLYNHKLTADKLKVGQEVQQNSGNEFLQRHNLDNRDSWIITDILGDGKFKAVPKERLISNINVKGFGGELKKANRLPDGNYYNDVETETFDISGKVDTSNPIYKFYEDTLGRYLRSKYGAKEVVDSKGVAWNEVEIKPEMKGPVEAFRVADDLAKLGMKITPDQEARIVALNRKMFGDENIKITEQIFTPEGQIALASYKNGLIKILKGQANPVDSFYHDAVHKYIDIFTSNKEQTELLIEGKKKYKTKDFAEAEEKIAEDFIRYAKSRQGVTGKIKLIFDTVLNRIKQYFGNESKIAEIYQEMLAGEKAIKPRPSLITTSDTGLKKYVKGRLSYNPDKINAPEAVESILKETSQIGKQFYRQRVSKTDKDLQDLAYEVNLTPEQLMTANPGSIANSETILKARRIQLDLAKDLSDYIKTIKTEDLTLKQAQKVKEKYLRLFGVSRSVAGFRTESSNAFRQFQLEVKPGENDIIKDLLVNLKSVDAKSAGDLSQFLNRTQREINPENIEKLLIVRRGGKPLTEQEAATLDAKVKRVNELEPATKDFENVLDHQKEVFDYLHARSEMEKYTESLNPTHELKVATSIIGRGTMLFSVKSPITNIIGNSVMGTLASAERRFASGQTSGLNGEYALQYMKFVNKLFNDTGYDLTRMVKLTSEKRVLGETRVHSEGPGIVRAIGRFYEDWIFRKTQGAPDVAFSSFHLTDSVNLASTKVAKQEGYTGAQAKARALEIFKDATSLNPKTEIGQKIREQAVADAMYATYQNDGRMARTALGIRETLNVATGDIRLGDLNIPFAKTPANVVGSGIESGGGGFVVSLARMRDAVAATKTGDKIAQKEAIQGAVRGFVRAGLGMSTAVIISSLLDKDDFIGTYPIDTRERNIMQMSGGGENMIRIGNKWVSLEYFGPLGPPIAGFMYAKKYGVNWHDKLYRYLQGLGTQLLRMPGIREVKDIASYMQESVSLDKTTADVVQDSKGSMVEFLRSRLVPGIVNDLAKLTDETERNAVTPGEKFVASLPFFREGLLVKVDVLGDEVKTPGASQLLFGARVKTATQDPVKNFLVENKLSISIPAKSTKIKRDGFPNGREMTNDEYYRYVKQSGQQIKRMIQEKMAYTNGMPNQELKQKEINKLIDIAREEAKNNI